MLRLVSSEDVGRDEANVQSLLKKHEEVTDELQNYSSTIDSLHQQAQQLGEQDRESPEVVERLASIDRRYKELVELAKLRKQRLLDALSLYKLFSEAEAVEQWVAEKVKTPHISCYVIHFNLSCFSRLPFLFSFTGSHVAIHGASKGY